MKNMSKSILEAVLALGLAFSLAGCGSGTSSGTETSGTETTETETSTTEAAAEEKKEFRADGNYTSLGLKYKDYVITEESMTGLTLELKEDGTGYLDFGTGNSGPVSSWSVDGSKFSMEAGVSDFTGELKDGILDLDFGEDTVIVFAQEGAEYDKTKVLSLEEYKEILTGSQGEADLSKYGGNKDAVGKYNIYAVESNGVCIRLPEDDDTIFYFVLNEDGTGTITVDEETENLLWKITGDRIEFFETDESPSTSQYEITWKKGIIRLEVPATEESGAIIEYFTTDDADVESIGAIDVSELQNN